MTKEEYMEAHHHITESCIGLIRVKLNSGDIETAKYFADKCSEELNRIFELRKNYLELMNENSTHI